MSKTNIVCPSCNATNLLPKERLGDEPLCGKCKERIFSAHPAELNGANFERHISKNDIPVLVVAKLNTEDEQMIGSRYGIRSIPTMVLFHKGEEIARQSGAMMAGDIIRWVQSQLVEA